METNIWHTLWCALLQTSFATTEQTGLAYRSIEVKFKMWNKQLKLLKSLCIFCQYKTESGASQLEDSELLNNKGGLELTDSFCIAQTDYQNPYYSKSLCQTKRFCTWQLFFFLPQRAEVNILTRYESRFESLNSKSSVI